MARAAKEAIKIVRAVHVYVQIGPQRRVRPSWVREPHTCSYTALVGTPPKSRDNTLRELGEVEAFDADLKAEAPLRRHRITAPAA
jgi:hypothetical protein